MRFVAMNDWLIHARTGLIRHSYQQGGGGGGGGGKGVVRYVLSSSLSTDPPTHPPTLLWFVRFLAMNDWLIHARTGLIRHRYQQQTGGGGGGKGVVR